MPAPYNYALNAQSPTQALTEGLQFGAGIAQLQANQQAAALKQLQQQQALELNRQIRSRTKALMENPSPVFDDYQNLALLLPHEDAKKVMDIQKGKSEEQQRNELGYAGQVMMAFKSGQNDIGLDLIRERAQAARNRGNEDEAKAAEVWLKLTENNAPDANMKIIGTMLAMVPGGDKVIESVIKQDTEARAEELHPMAIEKAAADLGLTKAQTNQAVLMGKKTNAETAKILLELTALKNTGGVDPSKVFEHEEKLRREYNALTAGHRETQSAYQRVISAENTPAGDIAMIFNFMKILDPGSVVREGEFATAQNAAGIPTRIQNMYNKAIEGIRLSPEQRKDFTRQAKNQFEGSSKQEKEIRAGYERIAKDYGLNAKNIFYSPEGQNEPKPVKDSPVTVTAPNGMTLTFPTQQAADSFKQAAGIR